MDDDREESDDRAFITHKTEYDIQSIKHTRGQ